MSRYFHKGDKVEVNREHDINRRGEGFWFPATVLRSSENRRGEIYVEFETLTAEGDETSLLKEYVQPAEVRPVAPPELHSFFKIGDVVEAFDMNAWCKGKVEDILENSKYSVSFGGSEAAEIDQWNLRPHRVWDDGVWNPPLLNHQEESKEVKSRELKLRVKFNERKHKPKYASGTLVEVRSDEEGYQGSWYTAIILGSMSDSKFLVEYQTLRTNDETELLKEEAHISDVRPFPPKIQRAGRFDRHDEVDALYNDGWWVGRISKVLDGSKYKVRFDKSEDDDMIFEHRELRPHQEWVNNNWVAAASKKSHSCSKPKELKLKVKLNKTLDPKMRKGAIVEVNSNDEGYQGSWFTAKIIEPLGTDKFVIEFLTLKTDDESQQLRETIDISSVRPCPPEIQRVDRFRLLEEVDAWYNDGWWVGLICRVLGELKYSVYFWTTNEELEFQHFKLRPHQDWVDGKWILSFRKKSKFPIKPLLIQKKVSNGTRRGIIGPKVEVESEENGEKGTWYPASNLGPVANTGKYLIEYKTLASPDNQYELLKEEMKECNIRPSPPVIQLTDQFKRFDQVDAWFNNGWTYGQIYKVLNASTYSVYFKTIDELSQIMHCNLRPHMDFVDNKWTTPPSRSGSNL